MSPTKTKAAIPTPLPRENAYEPPRFEPTGLDGETAFDTLLEMVRARRGDGPIPDYLRPLIDTGIEELRSAVPELADHQIASVLMVSASLLTQLIDRGPKWTRTTLVNVMLNLAEQLWQHDTPGAAELLEQIAAAAEPPVADPPTAGA